MDIPFRKTLLVGFVALYTSVVSAQGDCLAVVQPALEAANNVCTGISRNQACYAHISVQAEAQEGTTEIHFESPGDVVDLAGIDTLTLDPLDAERAIFGVALLQFQANLPEASPEQFVTLLAFGDVQIRNAVEANPIRVTLEAVPTRGIYVYREPAPSEPIFQLAGGETLLADGRNVDDSWVRIQLADGTIGWVVAELVTLNGDLSSLESVTSTTAPLTPLQEFFFQSGLGESSCAQAPESGVLIQAPTGVGQISLTVNAVDIQFGSTVYLQAQAGGEMRISVVDDQAIVSTAGITRFVPAGTQVRVPLDANLVANGAPVGPEPYDDARLAALPVDRMPRAVAIAPALTETQIANLIPSTLPVSGRWLYTASDEVTTEGDITCLRGTPLGFSREITFTGVFSLYIDIEPEFLNTEAGLFVADYDVGDGVVHEELLIISPTLLEGIKILEAAACKWTQPFRLERLSES